MASSVPEPEDFPMFIRGISAAVPELRSEARNDMRERFEETRAQRAARFAVLDRFRGGRAEARA